MAGNKKKRWMAHLSVRGGEREGWKATREKSSRFCASKLGLELF